MDGMCEMSYFQKSSRNKLLTSLTGLVACLLSTARAKDPCNPHGACVKV